MIIVQKEDDLVRRIPIYLSNFFKNGRPTSAVFKTKKGEKGLSVNILNLTTIEKSIIDKSKFAAAIFKAIIPMEAGFNCIHDPEIDNNAHALILGDTRKIAKKLSNICNIQYC